VKSGIVKGQNHCGFDFAKWIKRVVGFFGYWLTLMQKVQFLCRKSLLNYWPFSYINQNVIWDLRLSCLVEDASICFGVESRTEGGNPFLSKESIIWGLEKLLYMCCFHFHFALTKYVCVERKREKERVGPTFPNAHHQSSFPGLDFPHCFSCCGWRGRKKWINALLGKCILTHYVLHFLNHMSEPISCKKD
jgi:hypothetical protein